jgi:hypothetical protein
MRVGDGAAKATARRMKDNNMVTKQICSREIEI